ncbi:hypothetical protein ASPSYDRAFT_37776 [Aspergillus sydowii CBS 593.65]|uniref:Uncharacterized protein n=1 Tax=Aspergillus sydowii CBS 593.65 TaxID=1036612 RepID=A0A1L9TUZ1_9EURO|nr:uncharacterized protein ASPSYDRAFT_37776 [Aspergillus sydowii CBS 593.65]OJJ63250.1 hypothetical protein ASPSYDRAFT_37776 [Aspergillus sydowii CBS 593.65]
MPQQLREDICLLNFRRLTTRFAFEDCLRGKEICRPSPHTVYPLTLWKPRQSQYEKSAWIPNKLCKACLHLSILPLGTNEVSLCDAILNTSFTVQTVNCRPWSLTWTEEVRNLSGPVKLPPNPHRGQLLPSHFREALWQSIL